MGDLRERIRGAVSSEGIHAAFRKHSNSSEAISAWNAMKSIPADDWAGIMSAISYEIADAVLDVLAEEGV